MNRIFQNIKRLFKFRVIISVIIILIVFFQFALGRNYVPTRGRNQLQSRAANRNPAQSSMSNFQSSLEMKENVDFLISPALLVQEAISENVIITYPSE
jgi:hypothetical protein